MEIKRANELKEMVERHNEMVVIEKTKKVDELVNSIVEGTLVPAAKEGNVYTTLNCGEYKCEVIKRLRELGYMVDLMRANEVLVRWC